VNCRLGIVRIDSQCPHPICVRRYTLERVDACCMPMQCANLAFPRTRDMCVSDSLNTVGSCGVSYPRTRPDIAVSMLRGGVSTIDDVASVNEYSDPSYLGLPNDQGMFPAFFAVVFPCALAAPPGQPLSGSPLLVSRMASCAAPRIWIWVRGRRGEMVSRGWVVAEGSWPCAR
jgi:hypothetical protein